MQKLLLKLTVWIAFAGFLAGCGGTSDIGKERAQEIAFSDAGFTEEDVTRLHISRDKEDGEEVYDVEFTAEQTEYKYEIRSVDGDILSVDHEAVQNLEKADKDSFDHNGSFEDLQEQEKMPDAKQQTQETQTQDTDTAAQLTMEEAVKLVLDRVPGASKADLKIEMEYDDGRYKYEGDIMYEQREYEFEIDAATGDFLEWSEERR